MPLNDIVAIVLRLFSVSWLVQGLTGLAAMAAAFASIPSPYSSPWNYAGPVFLVTVAVATWFLAPGLARLVTPRPEASIELRGLTRYDLYCFAFVFLGSYFVLSSAANAINSTHFYLFLSRTVPQADPQRQTSFYELTQPLITCVAGGLCIAFASRLSKRLLIAERKYEGV